MSNIKISILILTKNEEQDLPACLKSVSWSDDIHVYDSFSSDKTIKIAKEFGATITQRVFDNWASHQNWGLKNISFKYDWVFYIDADERMTPSLIDSAGVAVRTANMSVAFRVQRRDFFMGTWLKHAQASPFYMRLFRPDKMHYERLVNPISIPNGPVGELNGYLDHFPFSKGIGHWIERHNSYSGFEARQIAINRLNKKSFSISASIFTSDFNVRRFNQKEIFYRLPFRPLIKFIILYIFKRGFMDGQAGLRYASLQAIYEYLIVLKTEEVERKENNF